MREDGFYWVLWGRDWEIGCWENSSNCWWMTGREDEYPDGTFKKIGPKIEQPKEQSDEFGGE